MQLSRRVVDFRFLPDVDVGIPHPRQGTLAGGSLTWDDGGCRDCGAGSCPYVSSQSQVLKGALAGSNVKGVDYRTVGRMALLAMKRNKVMYTSPE